ncbi:hypothetical protein OBBRIDRAFT_790230 [Obba rivulosa]|uniref:F-box domain-containing protein n=1 Tax=Obba rivulosa TaxID=1052685 RepID=A0A8E2DPR5_9APHY|nr:hypothetical protein OBBRIDRAFT_790230 [Obba rivulosa]
MRPEDIPLDILPLILEHLSDRRDLHNCARLCKSFNRAATPILYRTLDSRIVRTRKYAPAAVLHPARTLLQKPHYAKYVRKVTETGAVGIIEPEAILDCQRALRLCINLETFKWSDDSSDGSCQDHILLEFLKVIQILRVKQLTIRAYGGVSDQVWAKLKEFTGLSAVSLWCMEGQPRIMQGWSERLGDTLTHLELGRCAGVPPSIIVSVLSYLPRLESLRLKGAPSNAILEILTILPNLVTLDTEYLESGVMRYTDKPVASIRELTVRTSSVDVQGPVQLWTWLLRLLPRPSLECFTLNAFSTQGEATCPRQVLIELAKTQTDTLRHVYIDSVQMTLDDVTCLLMKFPNIETLSCSLALCQSPKVIEEAIASAQYLRILRLQTSWVAFHNGLDRCVIPFGTEDARKMMLRKDSQLRVISVGKVLYTGVWVRRELEDGSEQLGFEVLRDVVHDSWL